MHTTLKRLQERDAAEWRIDERFTHYQNALTDIVEKTSRKVVKYARSFEQPVIVFEDLSCIRERLDHDAYMNRRLPSWAFARLQGRIADKAREVGIRVEFVSPTYTSQTCHVDRRSTQAKFRCTNADWWISEYHADLNAASNIANRVDPWGESLPLKSTSDDFLESFAFQWSDNLRFSSTPQDRSTFDSATVHRETNRTSRQMTLSTFAG